MNRNALAIALVLSLLTGVALAHTGAHTILGIVVKCEPQRIVITKKDGREAAFAISKDTVFEREGKSVPRDEVLAGARVSIHLAHDGKTALKVKLAPKKT